MCCPQGRLGLIGARIVQWCWWGVVGLGWTNQANVKFEFMGRLLVENVYRQAPTAKTIRATSVCFELFFVNGKQLLKTHHTINYI